MRFVWHRSHSWFATSLLRNHSLSILAFAVACSSTSHWIRIPIRASTIFLPTLTIDNVYGTIGPTFSLQLYNRVDVRFEWVYKRFSYQLQSTVPPIAGYTSFSRIKAHSWEYPLLATYKFGSGNVRPFAGGGMNMGGTATSTSTDQNTITSTNPPVTTTSQRMTSMGLPTAYHIIGGLEWRFPIFSVRPELRYTRWTADTISGSFVANKPNQFEVVVGFTLHPFPASMSGLWSLREATGKSLSRGERVPRSGG